MVDMATGISSVLVGDGDGIVHEVTEDRSENERCGNHRIDCKTNFSIIDESSIIHGGEFSAFDVGALEGFSSDTDYSDDEDDIFCDDYGFLAEEDLAHGEFGHTRQVNAERNNNEPCRLEDILSCIDDSREETDGNAGIAFQEGDLGTDDLQTHSDESDEKEVMAQNDRLLSRKCVQGDYGIIRSLVTGEIVEGSIYPLVRRGPILVSTNRAPYAYKLHESSTRVQAIYKKLFTPSPSVKFGDKYRFNSSSDIWIIFWEAERLAEFTTFSLISTICGALNSRRRLHWCIGIDRHRRIEGCVMTNEQRDTIRQAFAYCIRSGIVPPLDPDHVQLKFIPVESIHDDETRLLVIITIDRRVSTLYQLSSGEIFNISRNELEVEGGMNEKEDEMLHRVLPRSLENLGSTRCGVYLKKATLLSERQYIWSTFSQVSRMLGFKENSDSCVISELDPEGYQRLQLKTNSVSGLIENSSIFALSMCVAYCARRLIYP